MITVNQNAFDAVMNLAKRRGFLLASSEIYGGLESIWDLAPLGAELTRNIKNAWWQNMVTRRENVVGLDAAIFMHPKVWEASGHVAGFNDPMAECVKCHKRWRTDKLPATSYQLPASKISCPECGGQLGEVKQFNLMFKTHFGPTEGTESLVYLRPETAQGIFVNFSAVQKALRLKLPFGIAQIGKAFRNEITTHNSLFRTREFEQMELEFFVRPGEDEKFYEYWRHERLNWYLDLGLKKENIRLREYDKKDLAHYSKATTDVEYNFPFGFDEIEGIANRTDFDLKAHAKLSGKPLEYFDPETEEKLVPFVIEPSAGVGRLMLAFLLDAYHEEQAPTADGQTETRVVLKLHPKLAPVKKAILPLVKNKPPLVEKARQVFDLLKEREAVTYDEAGAIGRRYRRQDEIGTPQCITVDFQTLEDDTVTVRDRDTMKQERVKIDELSSLN